MSASQPIALYAAKVPPGGILVPAVPNAAATFRVTMAAIDPDAMPDFEDEASANKPPRATLKIVRPPPGLDLGDESDESGEEGSEEESESDDESNGGPSDPSKIKKAKLAAALLGDAMDEDEEEEDGDEDDEENLKSAISKLIKGKGKALDDDEESESSDDLELEEVVVCTLDPEKHYQQPLDFVVNEEERVFFKVTGTHTVYLTGNYLLPLDEDGEESEGSEEGEEYDLSPDEDELDLDLIDEDDESDILDDLENPRVSEVASDEEPMEVPVVSKKDKKGKNKRPAEDSGDDAATLDAMMDKAKKPATEAATNGEQKLSKKQLKKLKKNNGEAAEATTEQKGQKDGKKSTKEAKTDKKVQFAKNLEQGPTPSPKGKTASKDGKKDVPAAKPSVRDVQGVTVDDRKLGTGRVAKKGDRVSMRYIGKLDSGKVFDANKSGKPFSFKVGTGEVIKGWDIGIPGMAIGGERRIIIPSHLAYGKAGVPGIPPNSKLTFDIKLLEIK